MTDCIFCKIIKGDIPCDKVYEDDNFLAFLDIKPLNPGHTLVIPKKHFQWVDDVENYNEYWQTARKISKAIQEALNPVMVAKLVYGLGVPHAHIHLVPKFDNDGHIGGINPNNNKQISQKETQKIAQQIKNSLNK